MMDITLAKALRNKAQEVEQKAANSLRDAKKSSEYAFHVVAKANEDFDFSSLLFTVASRLEARANRTEGRLL